MNDVADNGDLPVKLILCGVVAVIVGGVAAVSGVHIVVLLLAVLASVGGFWLLDSLLGVAGPAGGATAASLAPNRPAGPLPQTSARPLTPPRGVEAPTVGEPVTEAAPVEERVGAQLDPTLFETNSVEIKANSQGKARAFSIRVAKHGNTIDECEDAVAVDPRRAVLSVADGASSSFGAGLWARALTSHFVTAPPKPLSVGAFAVWMEGARSALMAEASDAESGAPNGWWSEQGAREGAWSTIVGAAIMTDGDARVVTVMCLGDSAAFVLTGAAGERSVRRSLPYEDASQFGSHPALLSSMSDRNHDEPTWTTVPTGPGDLLVLASDAVAEWLLGDPRRFQIFDGNEPEVIATTIIGERTDGRIVNDDLTIAVLELTA